MQARSSSSSVVLPTGPPDLFGGNERDQIERAHVGTQGTQHALVDVEGDVGEAAQAAGRLAASLLFGESGLHFGQANPALGRQGRDVEPIVAIVGVGEPMELLELNQLALHVRRRFPGEVLDGSRWRRCGRRRWPR